jgi:hypothetical protein
VIANVLVLAGMAIGALGMYAFSKRVELALRMVLDRRDQDLATERARSDRLEQQLISMRRDGFVGSRAGEVRPAADPDGQALQRAELQQRKRIADDVFLKKAVTKIRQERPDVSEAAAVREARKLLEAARMEQPPA